MGSSISSCDRVSVSVALPARSLASSESLAEDRLRPNDERLSDAVRAALPEVFDAIRRALEAHARLLVARAFGAGH